MKAVIIATLNKSSERWSAEDVSALLAIYSEDEKRRIQKLLLNAVSVAKSCRDDYEGKIKYMHCTVLICTILVLDVLLIAQ